MKFTGLNKLRKYTAVSFTIIILSFPAFVFGGGSKETSSPRIVAGEGAFAFITGEVRLNKKEAVMGEKVFSGDIIETGPDSYCEIIFSGRNVFRLIQNSSLEFGRQEFILNQGAIAIVTDKLKKIAFKGDALSVRTSSAVAGVRGTVFFIKKENDNNTYVCICSGEINTYAADGEDRVKDEAEHHKAMRITTDSSGNVVRTDAPLLYHDDALMEAVASRIGLDIGWRY